MDVDYKWFAVWKKFTREPTHTTDTIVVTIRTPRVVTQKCASYYVVKTEYLFQHDVYSDGTLGVGILILKNISIKKFRFSRLIAYQNETFELLDV